LATDSNLPPEPPDPEDVSPEETPLPGGDIHLGRLIPRPIDEELKDSYLTYSMSVIVSRALPDVRDGLKPSQRRILVAMSDLGLTPGASTSKCAGIVGETMKRYHPHGDMAIYPTLVRLAQDWATRYPLIDKQGNFGSIAGLPAAAMRYTEARMSTVAALMMDDTKMDTVDFLPTYDEKGLEPSVLPSKFPNLLVNGSQGIAVGMATSIPPHNLVEVCDALICLIDNPDVSIDELMEIVPGPDFPTGNIVCGRAGLRRGYYTGRGTITLRARARIEEHGKGRFRIVVNEVPYQAARDRVEERIAELVNDGRIAGISASRNESDLKEPVRLVLELEKKADPEVVLAQLYQFSPLQDTFSLIFLALVDGKPRVMGFKEMLEEFLRHRETVIRRRTLFLLAKARQRKHTVEGLLLALANIDEVIRTIRTSANQEEAKRRLMLIQTPATMLRRALGDDGYEIFQSERGLQDTYSLTPVQADAILRMTLGQLVNLEQEKLGGEHQELLAKIREYNRILSDRSNILDIIREDLKELKKKYPEPRRTEISGEEIGEVDLEDLIPEETMVVSISSNGYIKRTPVSAYRAQHRGGKGLTGAKTEDEDPIEHLFVASTHSYLMFFTNQGKVYWRKVYDLPQSARDSRGRAVVNLLSLQEGERITDCRAIRDFALPDHYLVMATAKGLVKKTPLEAYCRPRPSGIIAIKLRADDQLVDVVVACKGEELVLATAKGMAIRFRESDARPMGRASSGVKGIRLSKDDQVVGLVVADPEATLLTACANGYGKRTPFGPNSAADLSEDDLPEGEAGDDEAVDQQDAPEPDSPEDGADAQYPEGEDPEGEFPEAEGEGEHSSSRSYRTQRRGGKGVRDIKTTERNGPVIGIVRIREGDELLMMTARGKIQRIPSGDINIIGRNTQGVRFMSLDEGDALVAVKRVPMEEAAEKPKEETTPE
jgi:DNA gyrase subunit A